MADSLALDAFDKFDLEMGFSKKDDSFEGVSSGFDDQIVQELENRVKSTIPKGVDTQRNDADAADPENFIPEYWKEHEDLITKGFDIEEDKTNYSQLAMQKFGSEYSHLNSPEQVYDESYRQTEGGKYLDQNPRFREAQKVLQGGVTDADLVRQVLREKMDADPITFSRRMFDERIAELFDEDGLNEDGKRMANAFKGHYKNEYDKILHEATSHADTALQKEKEYRNVLNESLEKFSLFGVELPEDAKGYLKQLVRKNMVNPSQPKTPQERAERAINEAIFSDKKLLATVLRAVDKRGVEVGKTQKFKSKYN